MSKKNLNQPLSGKQPGQNERFAKPQQTSKNPLPNKGKGPAVGRGPAIENPLGGKRERDDNTSW